MSNRLAMIGLLVLLPLVLLARIESVGVIAKPLIVILAAIVALVIVVGWLGGLLLVKATSRHTSSDRGRIDPVKSWSLMQEFVSDVCDFRRW